LPAVQAARIVRLSREPVAVSATASLLATKPSPSKKVAPAAAVACQTPHFFIERRGSGLVLTACRCEGATDKRILGGFAKSETVRRLRPQQSDNVSTALSGSSLSMPTSMSRLGMPSSSG
jgi:hypothetical protein